MSYPTIIFFVTFYFSPVHARVHGLLARGEVEGRDGLGHDGLPVTVRPAGRAQTGRQPGARAQPERQTVERGVQRPAKREGNEISLI